MYASDAINGGETILINKIVSRTFPIFFPATHTQIATRSPAIVEKNADKFPTNTLFFTNTRLSLKILL